MWADGGGGGSVGEGYVYSVSESKNTLYIAGLYVPSVSCLLIIFKCLQNYTPLVHSNTRVK